MSHYSMLERLPGHILEDITLDADLSFLAGPPTTLCSMLRVSRTLYETLARKYNPVLYAHIFRGKFDIESPLRRLGRRVLDASALADEVIRRFSCLQRVKRNVYSQDQTTDATLTTDLWIIYLMFLENDEKNIHQLIDYGQVHLFAQNFVRLGGRMHNHSDESVWTVDSEVNSLALWIFWFTEYLRIQTETVDERLEILDSLFYIYMGPFKYPCVYFPITIFHTPPIGWTPDTPPSPRDIFPMSSSPVYPPSVIPQYFGNTLVLARPLIAAAGILASMARLGPPMPENAEGALGVLPEQDEVIRSGWAGVATVGFTGLEHDRQGMVNVQWEGDSHRHDCDWRRIFHCHDPRRSVLPATDVFTLGELEGNWVGRWMSASQEGIDGALIAAQSGLELYPDQIYLPAKPMQFRLREYYQSNTDSLAGIVDLAVDGTGTGALNCWLPQATNAVEQAGQSYLLLHEPEPERVLRYERYKEAYQVLEEEWPGEETPFAGGVRDVIITGITEGTFASIWGPDSCVGRVRPRDGLIVLVLPRRHDIARGRWVFFGYIHNGLTLSGRWRGTGASVTEQPLNDGVWSMVKSRYQ